MRNAVVLSSLLLAVSVSLAAAQGINLRLNDCGDFGTVNAPANCATNAGLAMAMVVSAVPPAGMDRVLACEAYIDAATHQATLSPWWTLDGCRSGALSFSFDFTAGPTNCIDFWAGGATGAGGIGPEHSQPNRFLIKMVGVTQDEHSMDPGAEHYLFWVRILRTKSVGVGACTGCTDAVVFVLNRVVIFQPAGVGEAVISTPMVSNYVTYNDGATPTQNRTWGQVKSLYR